MNKIPPAPFYHDANILYNCVTTKSSGAGAIVCTAHDVIVECREYAGLDFAAFIVLARNAADVMMRRGWTADPIGFGNGHEFGWKAFHRVKDKSWGGWYSAPVVPSEKAEDNCWPHPFTALMEADKWYRENVEQV